MDFFHAAVMRTLLVVIHSFIYLFLFFYLCIQHTYCMLTCYFYTKYVLFVIYVHVSYSTCILYTASLSYLAFSGSIQGPFHYYFTDSVIVGILVTSINSRWVLYALSRLSFCLCHRPPRYHHCHYIFLIKDLLNNLLYRAADSVALVD